MVMSLNPITARKVNDNNPTLSKELLSGRRKVKYSDQIDLLRVVSAKVIANPASPLKKIWVVP
ncbi:MAG: hypothetical protein BWX92_03662 [Deltaproteobacteria bacterium ADurb.Bin135]|nr:MAG: hypothetical protein BWX92_03662 [Deltaproteobacteria bacterium ADurb.Bin135]